MPQAHTFGVGHATLKQETSHQNPPFYNTWIYRMETVKPKTLAFRLDGNQKHPRITASA